MDFHIITQRGAELIMRTVEGKLEIVPPDLLTEVSKMTPPTEGDSSEFMA